MVSNMSNPLNSDASGQPGGEHNPVNAQEASSGKCLSYTDLVMLVLAKGVIAVEKLDPQPTRRTLVRAIDQLRIVRRGDVADSLQKRYLGNRGRGKPAPVEGERRPYRVQYGSNVDFARIPTSILGCRKGSVVMASFSRGRITIRAVDMDAPIDLPPEDDEDDNDDT